MHFFKQRSIDRSAIAHLLSTSCHSKLLTTLLTCAMFVVGMACSRVLADDLSRFTKWKHFTIAEKLPGSAWGTGGIGVADCDGNGSLDIAVSRRETKMAYWFERENDATWIRHDLGTDDHLEPTLGAATIDIDRDGWSDIAFWGVWFQNPGKSAAANTLWKAHAYDGGGHDVIAADINGDSVVDLLTYDGHELCWFDPAHDFAKHVLLEKRDDHGGMAPHGVGDLNGDTRLDIVIPGLWLENPGTETGIWPPHPWPHLGVKNASYGTSMRAWVADLNADGLNDIVYSDCDTGFSHVYVVANGGKGESWTRHQLPDPPGDPRTGSFHSLAVADFDADGTPEVFAGEQEDPDTYMTANGLLPMKPSGLKERGVIWVKSAAPDLEFTPVVIHEDNPGWHDAVAFDADGDGDLDIVTKIWNADGPTYHVDFWRNDIRDRTRQP